MPDDFDVIVIGSGAGGGAAAYKLVKAGKRVLMIEKGAPSAARRLDAVDRDRVQGGALLQQDRMAGRARQAIHPDRRTLQSRRQDQVVRRGAAALHRRTSSTPIRRSSASAGRSGYAELEARYDEAERMLHVNRFKNEPELQSVIDRIIADRSELAPEPLPLGLKPEIVNDPQEAKHFDGYASVAGYKGDSEECFIEPIENEPNFRLLARQGGRGLPACEPRRRRRSTGVICTDGGYFRAGKVVLAAAR